MSAGFRRCGRVVAAAGFVAAAGCGPVVTHGPRVEPGPTVGATGGIPYDVCTDCGADLLPTWGAYARYGFVPADSTGVRASLGLTLPYFATDGAELDGYVQLPSAPTRAYGVGVLASRYYVMPYVQYGGVTTNGSGFYTTQGVAFHRREQDWLEDEDIDTEEVRPRYWSPTVAVRRAFGAFALHGYLSAQLGDYEKRVRDPETGTWSSTGRHTFRSLSFGVTVEANLLPLLLDR